MAFKYATYTKADTAIFEGDLATLKKLMPEPLSSHDPKPLKWWLELIGSAAERGRDDMVHHLLDLAPLTEVARAQAVAWSHAMDLGHEASAQAWLPAGATNGNAWYGTAVAERCWRAVQTLLDQGCCPSPRQADQTLDELNKRLPFPPKGGALVRHLVPRASPTGLATGAAVAVRAGAEDMLEVCLAQASPGALKAELKRVISEAIFADQWDWAERAIQAAKATLTPREWVEHLTGALDFQRMGFFEQAMHTHPELLAWLAEHPKERFDVATRIIANASTQGMAPEATRPRQWVETLCPGEAMVELRRYLELYPGLNGTEPSTKEADRLNRLNTLAWWVDDATQQAWFEEAPETFAMAMALKRHQAAQHGTPTGAPPRARCRP